MDVLITYHPHTTPQLRGDVWYTKYATLGAPIEVTGEEFLFLI